MSKAEIIEAARAAFNERRLPRIAEGERTRGMAVFWVVAGKEVPEGEFSVAVDQSGEPDLSFYENADAEMPYKDELDDPDDKDAYYVHGLTLGNPGSRDSIEDWQAHIAALEDALKLVS